MNRKKWLPIACAAILATGLAGGTAFAATGEGEASDAALLANARIPLGQAIATAEQQAQGRAIQAGIDRERGVTSYAVEVAGKGGIRTVLIDPQTGRVTATRPAHEGEGAEADN